MRRTTLLAALGSAAVALAGCGGKDKPKPPKPLTKPAFIAKADTICNDVAGLTEPYSKKIAKLSAGRPTKALAPIIKGALTESRKGLARIRALPAPVADRATLNEYLAGAKQSLDLLEQLGAAAAANDRKKAQRLANRAAKLGGEQNRLAAEYGFGTCGTQAG